MDELDRKLIILLQADGRASNVELARALGVSEGTVRRRLRTLLNEQIVRIVAIPDPVKLGNTTTALVGLQVDPAQVDTVASELGRIDEVQYAAVTTGAYDVFLWVALGSPEQLAAFLRSKIGVIDGVRRTETFVNLSIKKNPAGPAAMAAISQG